MKRKEFLGFESIELSTGLIDLLIPISVGPRILSFSIKGGENLFAELPNSFLEFPGDGNFCFYGGHRLWLAPEDSSITYFPDNQPINIIESNGSVELVQEPNQITGIEKSMRISFTDYEEVIVIDHLIHNTGPQPFECAPWAITQFKLGGQVVIPQQIEDINKNSLLPDRSIVLWPYSDVNDPRIRWDNQFVFVKPEPVGQPLKIGVSNKEKWMAYFIDHVLFIKYADSKPPKQPLDLGATSECYCNSMFVELETLGALTQINTGSTIQHREVWRIVKNPFAALTPETMLDFINNDEMADVCRDMLKKE